MRCIRKPDEEKTIDCQMDVVDHLISRRPLYMKDFDCVTKNTCQMTEEEVRRLESYMLLFRDYANLVIMELTPIVEYFCVMKKDAKHAAKNCQTYSNDLKTEAD